MNTFLVDKSFEKTAQYLDYKRLGKQRSECKILLELLIDKNKTAWRNHPCTKLWEGFPDLLALYGLRICEEWVQRGYKDSLEHYFFDSYMQLETTRSTYPWWYGNEEFYSRYRSILLYKNYDWYSQFGWEEESAIPLKINKNDTVTLPYLWNAE